MGQRDAASVDIGAVLAAADRSDHLADLVAGAQRRHLTHPSFGAVVAGREYADRGEAVRAAVDQLGDDMRSWARAAAEIASWLRASAVGYAAAEARGAVRLG